MKSFLRVLILSAMSAGLAVSASAQKSDNWIESYNRLLAKYVTPAGVKYGAWKNDAADMQALQGVVNAVASANVGGMSRQDQLAFYVNAYNAWILHEALGKYPTKSVKDTFFSFFTSERIKVAGVQTSFKALEDNVIRAKFHDPHVHFALNCASRSCPPLNQEAFRADKLDGQFEKLAKYFVNSDRGVLAGADKKSVQLSKIFDWYKDDFKGEGGAVAFINKRRQAPIPADAPISYQEYNWALNEAK